MTTETFIRPMTTADVGDATRIWQLAFAKQFGAPDPENYRLDVRTIETRFATCPELCFVAERQGQLLGSIIGMDWGGMTVLGPLTIDPACWGQGIARRLTAWFLEAADARGARLVALYTFPQSATHLRLYESFGFAPMQLTPVLTKPVASTTTAVSSRLFREISAPERNSLLAQCRAISTALLAGLDLSHEMEMTDRLSLGETILLDAEGTVAGFAICHIGDGEAGRGNLFVKFAAVRPGDAAGFERLVAAIEAVAAARGMERITLGVNTARRDAYRRITARGYRADIVGVIMHRPDQVGTLRPDLYVIDDCR